MKLKHIILYYPSMERGGVTINLRHLITYLTNKNMKVSLISNNFDFKKIHLKKKNFFFFKIIPKF